MLTIILESIVYVKSRLNLLGGKKIVQGGGEILPKVSANFLGNFLNSRYHENRNSSYNNGQIDKQKMRCRVM